MVIRNEPTEMLLREGAAWHWLLNLERPDWRTKTFRQLMSQVIIRLNPGELGANSGAPLVSVSVELPNISERMRGEGNSLYEAVDDLHQKLWRKGIELPFP